MAAAGAAAFPMILLGLAAIFAIPIAFIVACVHVLLFGLPAYFVLRERRPVDWREALIAGFLIGSIPLAALQLLLTAMAGTLGFSIFWFLVTGILGTIGGAAFRAVVGPPAGLGSEREVASVFE
jgi:hypothetical protein